MRLLGQADVIIYAGSLVNPELLQYAKADCEIHNSAKLTLDEVIDIMTDDGAYTARDNIKNREDYIKLYNGITIVTVVFAVLITFIESILLYSYISMHIQSKRKDIIIMNSIFSI